MKNMNPQRKKIEHRGFDLSATKNFGLEMKIVKNFNRPLHKGIQSKSNDKSKNQEV